MTTLFDEVGGNLLPVRVAVDKAALWPDPTPLPSTLLTVDPFIEEMLPTGLRRWVVDIAERMNVPMDFVAVPAMIAGASLIGRKIGIKPQAYTDWLEPANLWGAVTGPPGTLKSPAVREAFTALRKFEQEEAEAYQQELEEQRPYQRLFELQEREVKRAASAMLKDSEDPLSARSMALDTLRQVEEPKPPRQIRYITNDATPEKLGELCRDNPNGLLIHRDELLTMFTDLDQEEKASGRGFLMTGWGGLDGYTVDRITRGTIRIEAVNLSLFGTTQPNRLLSYMRSSLKQHDDGLVQRLQLLVWPDFDQVWVNKDCHRDEAARDKAMACFDRLHRLSPEYVEAEFNPNDGSGAIPFLRFTAEAQGYFDAWRARLEEQVAELDIGDPLRGHFSKYRGLAPRLALICHLANGGVGPVTKQAWVMADLWVSYLRSHARRIYSALDTDNTDIAQRILAKLRKGELPITFTARDVYKPGWSGLKDRERIPKALEVLVDYDWLDVERQLTGGKPKTVFNVNPKALKTTLH